MFAYFLVAVVVAVLVFFVLPFVALLDDLCIAFSSLNAELCYLTLMVLSAASLLSLVFFLLSLISYCNRSLQ